MARLPLFVNGAYRASSPTADDEQTINFFPEVLKDEAPGAVAPIILLPTPGIENYRTVTEALGGRGAFTINGRCFMVIGSKLVEVLKDHGYVIRNDVGNDGKPARFTSNGISGQQLLIASAGQVYCYDLQTSVLDLVLTTLDPLVDNNLPAYYSHVGVSYGFFQAFDQNNSLFRISSNNDGSLLHWDATEFVARSTTGGVGADPWRAMLTTSYGETWMMGETSSEVWYNNADPDFPYALDQSGVIPYGIVAPFSICEANDKVVWLGTTKDGDLAVLAAQGFTPTRISDLALEAELDTYEVVDDAEGTTYRQAGHTFYKLTFPTEKQTWVFDFQTRMWHRRGTWLSEDNIFDEWRPTWYAFFDRRHLFCDRQTGEILEIRPDIYTDIDERPLRRVRVSPTIRQENKRLTHSRLEVLIEAGLPGGLTGPGIANPQMMLRCSDDGGKTWGNELMQPMGDLGQYRQRLVWEKLGQSVARTYELSCSEDMPVRVIDAFIEVAP